MRIENERSRIKVRIESRLKYLRLPPIDKEDAENILALSVLDPDTTTADQVRQVLGYGPSSHCNECWEETLGPSVWFGDEFEGVMVCMACLQKAMDGVALEP